MATFSTNQVRQLYVVEALKDPNVGKNDAVGSVAVKSDSSKTHTLTSTQIRIKTSPQSLQA